MNKCIAYSVYDLKMCIFVYKQVSHLQGHLSRYFLNHKVLECGGWPRIAMPLRSSLQMTFVEEEIDRLNESFLQLSVQLQQKHHADMRSKVTENSAGSSFVVIIWNWMHPVGS